MSEQPNLIVSSLDASRLEALLSAPSVRQGQDIRQLEAELDRADIMEPQQMPPDVVSMNSRVSFIIVDSGEQFTQTLVYPDRRDSVDDAISILAPVGSALIGLREGDSIAWPRPDGSKFTVKIDKILYQPERAGDMHR